MTEWEKTTGGKPSRTAQRQSLERPDVRDDRPSAATRSTKAWADARQRWEPLFEAVQMKGQSESHPSLSPTDDFAAGALGPRQPDPDAEARHDRGEYVREALKNGLKVEQDLGTNPFKFGMAAEPTPTTASWRPKRTTSSPNSRVPSPGRIGGTRTR